MANVDAEQNAAPTQQREGTAPSEFTLSEENLEALLQGVSGGAPLSKSAAPPAPAGAVPKPSTPARSAQIEPARTEEPIASLASLQGAPPMEALAPPPFEPAPVAVTPLQSAPQAAPQPDVNSKLALISAIKQRRAVTGAVTASPEAPARETETHAPVAPAIGAREPEQEETQVEHAGVYSDAAAEEEIAAPSESISVSPSRAVQIGNAPPRTTKVAPESQPQKTLPAKKIWTNGGQGGTAAPAEREPRRVDALRTETARPESAKKVMPKATVAAPVAEGPDASESNELFASFASGLPEQKEAAKPQNFISSKAGMGAIGGAIAAAALAVYFFTAHGSPKESTAAKAPAAPAEVASTVPPTVPSSEVKTVASVAAANQHTPTAPITAQAPGAKSTVTAQAQPARQIPAANSQQIPIAQQSAVTQPAPEAPRTAARAFKAPTAAGRPANSPVVDAAPALAINTATPAGVGLPARIAPLPPPPAPAAPAAAPTAAAPKQLNVAGAVQAAKLTRQIVPQYPAVAKAARVQGTVHFRALIGADGTVKALTTLGGPLPLAQAAADAVKQWRYQPTIVDGKPVEVTTQIDVAFTL